MNGDAPTVRMCEHCSGPIEGRRKHAIYCSPGCSQAAFVARRRDRNGRDRDERVLGAGQLRLFEVRGG